MRFVRPTVVPILIVGALAAALSAGQALAQDPPAVAAPVTPAAPAAPVTKSLPGGIAISSGKTIAQNVADNRGLEDFAAGITGASLADTLGGPGPFTVFIPTHGGFDRLERGTLVGWMKPDGKRRLTTVLSYHLVNGGLTGDALAEQVKTGKGEAPLATVQGGYITVKGGAKNLSLTDVNGTRARVVGEATASNGVIYLIDNVLQP